MAKFGLFNATRLVPLTEYEGDYMTRDKEYVEIKQHGTGDFPTPILVAAIRLDKGHDVRKISD